MRAWLPYQGNFQSGFYLKSPPMFEATLFPFLLHLVHSLGFEDSLRYEMRNKAKKQTDRSGPWFTQY